MSSKVHYAPTGEAKGVCGRTWNGVNGGTSSTFRTTCGSCIQRNAFQEAHARAVQDKKDAFMATTPRTFGEPWKDGLIECKECQGNLFRRDDRTCYGHYDNFKCSNCGHTESRLTETGMSF